MRPPMKKVDFNVGDKVEVASNEEGFFGSYYEATIVSRLENGQYMVRYKNLLEDDDNTKPLTETLYPKVLRPLPPRVRIPEFDYYQMVDAFDNDGWWLGKISGKLPAEKRGWKYKVYFHTTDEEIWYPSNRVRIHHEWVGGEWLAL